MGFRMISKVISVLLFIQYSVATADDILSGDAVDINSPDLFTIEKKSEDTLPKGDTNLQARRDATVLGVVFEYGKQAYDFYNDIRSLLPEAATCTSIVAIRNFLDTKALVNPVVYTKESKMKAVPPERIGPGEATVLEFDQASEDGKPEGSLVYNIEGTDLYVTILYHVVPPNTYNARIFRFEAKYSDVKVNLHSSMKTVDDFYPLKADDTIQYDVRLECGYKVSVVMTDHEKATMQVDVYDCQDTIDKTVLVVANQTANESIVDPLGCEPGDLPNCGCCQTISNANTLFLFPVIWTHVFFSTLLSMFYGIP
ncbi:uncharacterized protein LOC106179277 [Lingula anatina]|uniref:Uncharacterized protein LOC106179277 n=1 Tax=Lingula anatina TaxID=7574 RepID=A0A1S3K759_LINAN|nr:uncharacterized protein LOC106179277 [Lingula anatina]|eukprot:XP_013418279.1 uncharacterized protein LOC106179277 [Lingula anatina]